MSNIESRLAAKKLLHYYQHAINQSINLFDSSNHFWDTPDLKVNWSVFDHARSIVIKVSLSFPKFKSACKKSFYSWNAADLES